MAGILGTRAGMSADANLLLQTIIFILLMMGVAFVKKKNLPSHEKAMKAVAALNLVSLLSVMVPSLVINLGPLLTSYPALGTTALVHAMIGGPAAIFGITWAFRKFRNIRTWMLITVSLWLLGYLLGIANYVMGYIL